MSYKENEVVAKYTKGNNLSDCGKYNVNDLLEMFDQVESIKGGLKGVVIGEVLCYYNNEIDVPCSLELDYEFQYQSE